MRLDVKPFRADCTDKDAAVKVLEEAAEVFGAWQEAESCGKLITEYRPGMQGNYDLGAYCDAVDRLADEIADCITACVNLAGRKSILTAGRGHNLQSAMRRVERKNRERGRYDG